MKEIFDFLTELNTNNNREWFEANKPRYKLLQERFNLFVGEIIEGISVFDPSVKALQAKDCVYRIYRDTRFSKNKGPYKNYFGAYICPDGKKSSFGGYYFHIEPCEANYIGSSVLAVGLHCPEPKFAQSVREDIFDNGELFVDALDKASEAGFVLSQELKLKRVPKGFPADSPYSEYLKLKEFSMLKPISLEYLTSKELLKHVLKDFESGQDLNNILTRSVKFAKEEM